MKKFLPIAMAAVMSMSAVAVSAVSANAVEPLNTPVQYAQVARASLATPKISKAESVYGGVKLTWNKVNGAAKYRVYYKGRKGWTRMVDTTSTSYIDKDVSSGRNYTYTVRCISADGKSFTSGYDSKGTTVKYIATPEISKAESVYGGVKLTWNKVSGAAKYRVYRKGNNGWTKLADTTSTTYKDKSVSSGKSYTYTVRCLSKDGKKFTSGYDSKGKSVKYVAAPKIFKVESVYDGTKITWNKVTGAEKYRVYYKDRTGWNKLVDTTGTSVVDIGVVSKEYSPYVSVGSFYTVRCISKDAKSFTSGYDSKGKELVNYQDYPEITNIESVSNGINISWVYSSFDDKFSKYRIYIKENGSWKKIGETKDSYFVHKNPKAGKSYTYTVRCISKDGKRFTSIYNPSGVTFKYKMTDKVRDKYIEYMLQHPDEWLPSSINDGDVHIGRFIDLDFDGVPEFLIDDFSSVLTFKDDKVQKVTCYGLIYSGYFNYLGYYNKSTKKYGLTAINNAISDNILTQHFKVSFDGSIVCLDEFTRLSIWLSPNGEMSDPIYTYTGPEATSLSKSRYNEINIKAYQNCVNIHMYTQYLYLSAKYTNWNAMSYSRKKQLLLDSYNAFSYDKY